MNETTTPLSSRDDARRASVRPVTALVGTFLAISAATLIAMIVLRNDSAIVTTAVWIRGSIVVASAAILFAIALRVAAGSASAYLRLRIISAVVLVAIVVIVALPGTFPVWFRIEQGVCGLALLAVVLLVNRRALREHFSTKRTPDTV